MLFYVLFAVVFGFITFIIWPLMVYFVFRKYLCKRDELKAAGEWAIVTGPSEGIGRAFAELLSKEGLNVFLIGLKNSGLEAVAADLEKKYNVETKIFFADLVKASDNSMTFFIIYRKIFLMISYS